MATAIQENLGIPCRSDETIREITRGIRAHFIKFVKPLAGGGLEQAQLGLGHSYSRGKVRDSLFYRSTIIGMSMVHSLLHDANSYLDDERFLRLIVSPSSAAEITNPSL